MFASGIQVESVVARREGRKIKEILNEEPGLLAAQEIADLLIEGGLKLSASGKLAWERLSCFVEPSLTGACCLEFEILRGLERMNQSQREPSNLLCTSNTSPQGDVDTHLAAFAAGLLNRPTGN
jgi:riboflavin biosynthesis pyrimidine reductase